MLVSVLSGLARSDVDPRQEAAKLAKLPEDAATMRTQSNSNVVCCTLAFRAASFCQYLAACAPQGDLAFGMIRRGELNGVSAGYRFTRWRVENEDGETIDAENTFWSDGDNFTYIAERWELLECSCVNIAADSGGALRPPQACDWSAIGRATVFRQPSLRLWLPAHFQHHRA